MPWFPLGTADRLGSVAVAVSTTVTDTGTPGADSRPLSLTNVSTYTRLSLVVLDPATSTVGVPMAVGGLGMPSVRALAGPGAPGRARAVSVVFGAPSPVKWISSAESLAIRVRTTSTSVVHCSQLAVSLGVLRPMRHAEMMGVAPPVVTTVVAAGSGRKSALPRRMLAAITPRPGFRRLGCTSELQPRKASHAAISAMGYASACLAVCCASVSIMTLALMPSDCKNRL